MTLTPAGTWNVTGGDDPDAWRYRADTFGPDRSRTRTVEAAGVLHFRYGVDPARHWHGLGPVRFADITGRLSAGTDNAHADESSGPRANLIPIPVDGQHPTVELLRKDIAGAKGKALTVESVSSWEDDGGKAQRHDWGGTAWGESPGSPG